MNHKQEFTQEQIKQRSKENSEFVSNVEQDTEIQEEYGLLDESEINRPHRSK